jgi:hypothetical protein
VIRAPATVRLGVNETWAFKEGPVVQIGVSGSLDDQRGAGAATAWAGWSIPRSHPDAVSTTSATQDPMIR